VDTRIKLKGRTPKILAALLLVLFAVSISAAMVSASPATSTVTVTKGGVACEGAFVNVFKTTKNYNGLYYSTGDPVATNITDASGACTFSLDPALMYQFQINYLGAEYQINSLGASSVAIALGYTAQVRANAMPWLIGAFIAVAGLVVLGYIKFTNKGPFQIKA
jgi:hypothetical protein